VFKYTTNSSTSVQTMVSAVFTTNNGGTWNLSGDVLEENSRSVTAPYTVNGSFHRWMWASYKYVETQICTRFGCTETW
jgi:hypothetical protein